jgi:hypothetical protein
MHHSRMGFRRRRAVFLASIVVEPILMKLRGYPIGGMLVVRCREGHLFTTLWIPGVSVKAVRLGWWRVQRCPVGGHWSVVTPVKASDLTERERRRARRTRDIPIP